MTAASPVASPKVDDRFTSHGGFVLQQEVYVLHPTESWIRGTITEIRAIAKKGGFAEVCFAVTPLLDSKLVPNVTSAAPMFPLREHEVHAIVSDTSAAAGATSSNGSNSGESEGRSPEVAELEGDTVSDLLQLSYLHDSTLLEQVRKRYFRSLMYTHIGPILLALNPYDFTLKHYVDANLPKYIGEGDSVVTKASVNLPHAWTTAHYSYWLMSTERENQSVIVSGESGAGKTETAKIVVRYLGKVSTSQCNDKERAAAEQVTVRVNLTSPILEAFGNAKTRMNDNSSRFGKFMKVYFERGSSSSSSSGAVMTGAAIEVYLLEKSRIITHGEGERSYHCFYQLLAEGGGACSAESRANKSALKRDMSLRSASDVPSLQVGHATQIPGVDDAADFDEVTKAMVAVGLDAAEQRSVWSVISGVLHLLQVEFQSTSDDACAMDDATPACAAHLASLEALLHISVSKLCSELTTTTNVTRGETIVRKLRRALAVDLRDALAKTLYEALFLWLVAKINDCIRPRDEDDGDNLSSGHGRNNGNASQVSWIGLLDIFGFENFAHGNSFEQMCINLANETLQNHYNGIIFTRDMQECRAEGINTESVTFYDNQPCLDLLCGVNFTACGLPGGSATVTNKLSIMSLIDESCSLATGTDLTLCAKIVDTYGGTVSHHANFSKPKTQNNAFNIIHYAGEVKYTIDGFRAKNADTLKESLKDVIRDSNDPFVSQLLAVPPGSPTTSSSSSSSTKKSSVGSFFKNQLIALMTEINSTHPHWIRCVKPHSAKKPRMFHGAEVMAQLRSAGVLETVRIRQQSYSIRIAFADFAERYRHLLLPQPWNTALSVVRTIAEELHEGGGGGVDVHQHAKSLQQRFHYVRAAGDVDSAAAACREILRRCLIQRDEVAQVGKLKVFLRTKAFHILTQALRLVKSSLSLTVQAYARAQRSGLLLRCLQLNSNLKTIAAFCRYRPSHHVFRVLEVRAREQELLTKFRKLMILQTEEATARSAIMDESIVGVAYQGFCDQRRADLVALEAAWWERKKELDLAAQDAVVRTEQEGRRIVEAGEQSTRDIFALLLDIERNEESLRCCIADAENTLRTGAIKDKHAELLAALAAYRRERLLALLKCVALGETRGREAIEDDERSVVQRLLPMLELEQKEVTTRNGIVNRERLRWVEFPMLAVRQLEELKRQWQQRQGYRDRYTSLLLQREEQTQRCAVEDAWEQELAELLEEVNEDELRALNDQYEREAREARDCMAMRQQELLLVEAEEKKTFEAMQKEARALWNEAQEKHKAETAIQRVRSAIGSLRREQCALSLEFMAYCREVEVGGATINSSRSTVGRSSAIASRIHKSVEVLRRQQVHIAQKLEQQEAELERLLLQQEAQSAHITLRLPSEHRQEQRASSSAGGNSRSEFLELRSASLRRIEALRVGDPLSSESIPRSTSRSPGGGEDAGESQQGDRSPSRALVATGGSQTVPHVGAAPVTNALRQASVHHTGTLGLMERLSVIRASASSSNYAHDPSQRNVAKGDAELIPEFVDHERQQRKLERYQAARRDQQRERLLCMESGGTAATTARHRGGDNHVGPLVHWNRWRETLAKMKEQGRHHERPSVGIDTISGTPASALAVETSLTSSPSRSPSEGRCGSTGGVRYCSPRVVYGDYYQPRSGVVRHSGRPAQLFPRASKNPFSEAWRPVAPPAGGVPGASYCYLPDGSIVMLSASLGLRSSTVAGSADNSTSVASPSPTEIVVDLDSTDMQRVDGGNASGDARRESYSPEPREVVKST